MSTSATAVVVVEGSSGNEGVRTDAVARFVRARNGAVDDDALRMVGATVDFPAVGGCGRLASASAHTPSAHAIALLDVGAVTLIAGESVAPLQRRQLPDVADLVSGVVYSAAARGGALPSKSAYLLRVDGAPRNPTFRPSSSAPTPRASRRTSGSAGTTAEAARSPSRWECRST